MLSFYEVCLAVGALWAKAGFLKSRVGAVVLSWADGPYHISDFPEGATVSHRFPVVASATDEIRTIDDFIVSGQNDTCVVHNMVELHMVGTCVAVVRSVFQQCASSQKWSKLCSSEDMASRVRSVIDHRLACGSLDRQECVSLCGNLGLADYFLHGWL